MKQTVSRLLAKVDAAVAAAFAPDSPAGFSPTDSSEARAACFLGAAIAGILVGLPGLLTVVAVAAIALVRRRRQRAQAERRLLGELHDAVPLLEVAVGAGLTVRSALVAVEPWCTGALGAHLAGVVRRVEAGAGLAEELDRMPDQLGETCRGLVAVLGAAERYGSPLVEPLARLGAELRLQRRRQLEQAARQVPVHLLFPLTLGVLPAFVLLAVVPLAATALDGLVLPGG